MNALKIRRKIETLLSRDYELQGNIATESYYKFKTIPVQETKQILCRDIF
jgi:hypothetical protein